MDRSIDSALLAAPGSPLVARDLIVLYVALVGMQLLCIRCLLLDIWLCPRFSVPAHHARGYSKQSQRSYAPGEGSQWPTGKGILRSIKKKSKRFQVPEPRKTIFQAISETIHTDMDPSILPSTFQENNPKKIVTHTSLLIFVFITLLIMSFGCISVNFNTSTVKHLYGEFIGSDAWCIEAIKAEYSGTWALGLKSGWHMLLTRDICKGCHHRGM